MRRPFYQQSMNIIELHGRRDDTYCFTEPKRNAWAYSMVFLHHSVWKFLEPSDHKDSIASCNHWTS